MGLGRIDNVVIHFENYSNKRIYIHDDDDDDDASDDDVTKGPPLSCLWNP